MPEMGSFVFQGSKNGEKYCVTLFPNKKCNCPSTTRCYHIIAAMLSICMPIPEGKKVMNLTQLRKNCRPRNSKKKRYKKGRKGDNDNEIINAAPDSEMTQNNSQPATPVSELEEISPSSNKKAKKSLRFGQLNDLILRHQNQSLRLRNVK